MGLFQKKHDPISEKARALTAQIEALEAQIKQLSIGGTATQPRFRSSTAPGGAAPHSPARLQESREHFERIDHRPLQSAAPTPVREKQSELGVSRPDHPTAWHRLKELFKPLPASNPKLVNYLAAGSIQGLRPLRYEKRVARNRFIFLVVVLLLVLWGILKALVFKH